MGDYRSHHNEWIRSALLILLAALLIFGLSNATEKASAAPSETGNTLSEVADGPSEAAASSTGCTARGGVRPLAGTTDASCPRLPGKVSQPEPTTDAGTHTTAAEATPSVSKLVTNKAGDRLEVTAARPGTLWTEGPSTWVTNCNLTQPEVGSGYMPCGYVKFYDAGWESSEKAPDTDLIEDSVYDSCGTLVTSDKAEKWHVVGTEYTDSGWHASTHTAVPGSEPHSCLGTWRLIYTYTQTFSDKETLSDSIEVTFGVTARPKSKRDHWGGGNPTEAFCWKCAGDPVNTATGEYSEAAIDLAFPGVGPHLSMGRTYSSTAAGAGVSSTLGVGWAASYDMSLAIDPETGDAAVTNENGSITEFEAVSGGGFDAPPSVLATLTEDEGGGYTYTVRGRTIYHFDSSGRLISTSDLDGDETTFAYESGHLHTATDQYGRTFTFRYNGAGRLAEVEDSSGRSVTYSYNASGLLSEVTDARGDHERFTYDPEGLLLTREDARGHVVVTNTYDGSGRVETQTNALGDDTSFEYEEGEHGAEVTEVTGPRGYGTLYEYQDEVLVREADGIGSGHRAEWTFEYDPATLEESAVTDPEGHTSRMTYDAAGDRTSYEDALGNRTEYVYDALGDPIESTDAEGVTTTYEYDARGNLLRTATPLLGTSPLEERVVEYAYEDPAHPGAPTSTTDADGNTTDMTYDADGYLASRTDPEGNETTFTYNERGRLTAEVSPRGNVAGANPAEYTSTFTYDPQGDRLTATNALGDEREWTYDADGNLLTETNPNGHTTTYTYDAANQQTAVESPGGHIEHTAYDEDGNVESRTNALGKTTSYGYDGFDRLEEETDPLGRTTKFTYDQAGQLVGIEDPSHRTTTYSYDAAGDLTGIEYGSEPGRDTEFTYDADVRRTSMTDESGETTYGYDSLGRLVTATDGNGDTTSFGYDLEGRETDIVYPNGKEVVRDFDNDGRLADVTDWLGNTTTFSYDADNDLGKTTYPTATGDVDEYKYDHADQLNEILMKQGAGTLASLQYSRDPNGNVSSLSSHGLPGAESEAFEYDADNRLTKAGSETFEYDAAGELTKLNGSAETYDEAGELATSPEKSYGYDALGERTKRSRPPFNYVSSFGSSGSGTGKFSHPAGIAVTSSGDIWVVDLSNRRVEKFNSKGEYLTSFGSSGSGNGQFIRPTDIAIDPEGHLWVTDTGNDRVEEFSESGTYLSQFGSAGTTNGKFEEPEGIATDSSGDIWVADTRNGRAQEFNDKGEFIKVVGTKGTAEGQVQEASDVAVDPSGNVWISDWANHVDEYNSEGKFIRWIGGKGTGHGQFVHALSLAIDAEGHVFVGDEGNDRIQEFNDTGEYLGQFGAEGTGAGQFKFTWPIGLALDGKGNLWVSDTLNNRVEHWAVGEDPTPTTFSFDQSGDLTGVEQPATAESAAIEEENEYNGDGLLVSQTVSGATSQLTWDHSGALPLLLADGGTSYIYGPEGLPIEQISALETPTFYHHDGLGSTRMLTNASGASVGTFSFTAYGAASGHTGSATTPLGYDGQFTFGQSGLVYLRTRAYDPSTGQFLSRDALEGITGEPYEYAEDNPMSNTDPSGLLSIPAPEICVDDMCASPPGIPVEDLEALGNVLGDIAGSYKDQVEFKPGEVPGEEAHSDEGNLGKECPIKKAEKHREEIGDAREAITKAEHQVNKYWHTHEGNQSPPGGPKWIKVLTILISLWHFFHPIW